jgi:hypothetical protein
VSRPAAETIRLFAPASLRQRWVEGHLPEEWFAAYSGFFLDEDLRLTRNQRSGHFGEWFAALDYRIHGNEVLIEKYVYKPGTRSYKRAHEVLGEHFEFIREGRVPGYRKYTQPPDLLVIEPGDTYFFAEVKLGRDAMRKNQRDFFAAITARTGRRVVEVEVKVLKPQPAPD